MPTPLRPPRTPSRLSDSVHHQLNLYALAASAAGVGMVALAEPVDAKIIYTPVHHVIGRNSYFGIDLNHDGIVDFTIANSAWRWYNASINSVDVWANQQKSDSVEGDFLWPLLLAADVSCGVSIPSGRFYAFGQLAVQCVHGTSIKTAPCRSRRSNTAGFWPNVTGRYLGLKFTIHGKVHYGWARLNVKVSRDPAKMTATLTGFAYETISNKSIIAGKTKGAEVIKAAEPASLGWLARGSAGLAASRQKESTAGTH